MNKPFYHLELKPVIFGAFGPEQSGRETTMKFLAELLWDRGHLNLKAFDFPSPEAAPQFVDLYNKWNWAPLGIKPEMYPIIMVPRIKDEETYLFLKNYPNTIFFHVERCDHETKKAFRPEEDQQWIYKSSAYPINNSNSLRLLNFQLRNIFNNEIVSSPVWKKIYAPTTRPATRHGS